MTKKSASSRAAKRAWARADDIRKAIGNVRQLLKDRDFASVSAEPLVQAAFERFLEIMSEASRHLPPEWKERFGPDVPWRRIADLGNHLRHAYQLVDLAKLWAIYRDGIDPLADSVDRMIAAYEADGP